MPTMPPDSPLPRIRLRYWLALGGLLAALLAMTAALLVPAVVGHLNDDGLYISSARALAEGKGYIYDFAPGIEPASRYPIGYPALLAILVRLFPDSLEQLVAMQWHSTLHMMLFLGGAFVLLVKGLDVKPLPALAIAGLVGLHPIVQDLGTVIMSDVPFASVATLALLVLLIAVKGDRDRWGLLGLAGVLIAAASLMRYQGVMLAVAGVLALWLARRFKAGFLLGAVSAVPLVPWIVWMFSNKAVDYQQHFSHETGDMGLLDFIREFGRSAHYLFVKGIPGAYFPGLSPTSTLDPYLVSTPPGLVLLGYALSLLTLLGLGMAIVRPRHVMERILALYVALTLLLVLGWNLAYTYLGYQQVVRLTLGLLPFYVYFGMTMAGRLGRSLPSSRRWLLPASAGMALVIGVVGALQAYSTERYAREVFQDRGRAYSQAFAFVRARLPQDAVLGSFLAPMIHLYTGRHAVNLGFDPRGLAETAVTHRIDYLFGGSRNYTGTDAWSDYLRWANEHQPGLLTPVFINDQSGLSVWAVNRDRAAALLKAD
jgi:4-amino-4-deoxy-L-arabinose transferase-like glycosyltransferase